MKLLITATVFLVLSATVAKSSPVIQDLADNSDVDSTNRTKRQSTASCTSCPFPLVNTTDYVNYINQWFGWNMKSGNLIIDLYTGADGCLYANLSCSGLGYATVDFIYGGNFPGHYLPIAWPIYNKSADEVVTVSNYLRCFPSGWYMDTPLVQPAQFACVVTNLLPTTTTTTTSTTTTTTKASCTSCQKPTIDRTIGSDELIGVATKDISFHTFTSHKCSYLRIVCNGVGWAMIKARTNSGITVVASNHGSTSSSPVTVQANVTCHAGNWLSECPEAAPIDNKFFCDVLSTTATTTTTTMPLNLFLEPYLTPIRRAESGTNPSFHIYSLDASDFKSLLDKYCGTEETSVGRIVVPDDWTKVRTKCPNLMLMNWLRKIPGNPLTAFGEYNRTFAQIDQFYCAAERGDCGANFQLTTILSQDGTRDIFIPSSDNERQAVLTSNVGYQNVVYQKPCWIWQ